MPFPKRTQKQLAAQYKGNLDYFHKPHAFRTAKLIAFVLAALVSVAIAFAPHHETLFSTGPISANHAGFEDRCEVCHEGAQPKLLGGSPTTIAGVPQASDEKKGLWASLFTQLGLRQKPGLKEHPSSLEELDRACLKCHEPMKLHQPQSQALSLAPLRREISVAEIGSCSMCHREHQGPAKMKDPPSSNCVDCHKDTNKLNATLVTYQTGGKPVPQNGVTTQYDHVRHFVPPRLVPHVPVAIRSFADGHPDFGYEQPGQIDHAALQFNHSRHLPKTGNGGYDDIGELVKGHKLTCTDCHEPGADGVYMVPVTYDRHCGQCHSLHLSTELPDLKIPHKEPEVVHNSITNSGLTILFYDYENKKGVTDLNAQQAFARDQFAKLAQRGITNTDTLMARVFRTGEPAGAKEQIFPACAKCHVVSQSKSNITPTIAPTNTPERWLVRGPFNHKAHLHMECTDCHGQALASQKTSDILLPPKALCATCHREMNKQDQTKPFQTIDNTARNPLLVQQQESQGGVQAECQYCHPRYHAPAGATMFIKTHKPVAPPPGGPPLAKE